MKFRILFTSFLFTFSAVFTAGQSAIYATQAHDDAADPVYDGDPGWDNGDNGGSGFNPWSLEVFIPSGGAGYFMASSVSNGIGADVPPADGDIDTSGRAWGMFANGGATANAFRGFQQPLLPNNIFSVSMDNGFVDQGGTVGMALRTFGAVDRFELLFIGGQNTYLINDDVVSFDTNIGFTDQGLDLQLTLTGPDTYDLLLTRLSDDMEFPFPGRTFAASGDITNFRGFNTNAGFNAPNNLFFNNLAITSVSEPSPIPEPSSFGLLAIGMTALLMFGRRRRR